MSTKTRVVITGLGPISAIGCGRQEFWQSLVMGRHGFGRITLCDTSRSPTKIGAEVKNFSLQRFIDSETLNAELLPRPVQFALAASALALEDAGFHSRDWDLNRIGVCVGTSVGNIGDGIETISKWLGSASRIAPDEAFHLFHHSAACTLSSFFNFRGPIHTISSGCNSGIDAVGHAMRLIQLGVVDAMVVVGTDCELVPEVLAILNASDSLTTRYNDDPGRASRPFDLERDGNVIGEGAAALWLEAEPLASSRGANCYARVDGYSVCAAGNRRRYSAHVPDFDLRPFCRAMQDAMSEANWLTTDVDLINANGSSSVIYDRIEAMALAETFGSEFAGIRVHSIKSMLGQHGAGSSALQAVAACLSLHQGIAPPTINYEKPDPACGSMRIITAAENYKLRTALVNSIGFGGFYYSSAAFSAANHEAMAGRNARPTSLE